MRLCATAILAALCLTVAYPVMQGASVLPLYGAMPYAHLAPDATTAVAIRLTVLAGGIAAATAFLIIVPRHPGWITQLGRRSLRIYLLHGFVVLLIWAMTPSPAYHDTTSFLIGSAGVAVSVSLILANLRSPRIAIARIMPRA